MGGAYQPFPPPGYWGQHPADWDGPAGQGDGEGSRVEWHHADDVAGVTVGHERLDPAVERREAAAVADGQGNQVGIGDLLVPDDTTERDVR